MGPRLRGDDIGNAPTKKNPALRRDFPSHSLSPSILSELAVPLALLTLAALTVRILLLLAGLLAAALLLAGLLTRVLILLARILVLVGHSGSPFLRCGKHNGETTAKAQVWFPENFGSRAIIAWRRFVASVALEPAKTTRVQPLEPRPALLPLRVPAVRKYLQRGVPAAGAIAASRRAYSAKVGTGFATRMRTSF